VLPSSGARRKAVVAAGVLAVIVGSGALFEIVASRRARRNPPGVLVDLGGRRIHLLCIGAGRPTIIFEPSSFGSSISFTEAREHVARTARVCSYDRLGSGWSDDSPSELSVGALADDLLRLQQKASIDSPVVLVASSMGGAVAEMFARRHPERVAGLVFLDAANSELLETVDATIDEKTRASIGAACFAIRVARPIGVLRLFDARTGVWSMLCAAIRALPTTLVEFHDAPLLSPDIPMVVMSAETSDDLLPKGPFVPASVRESAVLQRVMRQLRETHQHLAARSNHGRWVVVSGSGHLIAGDRPDVVTNAVLDIVTPKSSSR